MRKKISERRRLLDERLAKVERDYQEMGKDVSTEMWDELRSLQADNSAVGDILSSADLGLRKIKRMATAERAAFEAMSIEMPKWRTTILLGLNSAAIVAVIANENIAPAISAPASLMFLLGTLAAYASGNALDRAGKAGLHMAADIEHADIDNEPADDDELSDVRRNAGRLHRASVLVELSRLLSLGCFILGVITVALKLNPTG